MCNYCQVKEGSILPQCYIINILNLSDNLQLEVHNHVYQPQSWIYLLLSASCAYNEMVTAFLSPLYVAGHQQKIRVWILGDSIVKRAKSAAYNRYHGRHLGLPNVSVNFKGSGGLHLSEFPNLLERLLQESPRRAPDILLIHCGTCDIAEKFVAGKDPSGSSKSVRTLLARGRRVIRRAQKILGPKGRVMWSHILPRPYYHGANNQSAIDNKRKLINRKMSSIVGEPNGIWHRQFTVLNDNKLIKEHPDFVHPTERGFNVLLSNWKIALSKVIHDHH